MLRGRFGFRLMVMVIVRLSVRVRVGKTATANAKAAQFTGLLVQSCRNKHSFNKKHFLSVHTSVPRGNHVHKVGTNKRACT